MNTGMNIVLPVFFRFGWLAALTGVAGCGSAKVTADSVWSLSGPTMGTRYAISVVGGEQAEAEALQAKVTERLAEVNRRMSTYDPESELSRFNSSETTEWFAVSEETASVVGAALELSRDSSGAYDPTVGPLVNLWGFGPGKRRGRPPTDEEIIAAGATVGHGLIEVRLDVPALRKNEPGVYVDLSSIAKGHGVDAIAELLETAGVGAYMIEIGGEVRTRGRKPDDRPWRIGVERVDSSLPAAGGGRPLQRVVSLVDRSMATSGDYRNFFEHDGVRYSHTLDPTTGRPVSHDLATVTVIAETCREADGLATALLVLGPTAGYDWAVEHEVAALFVRRTTADELAEQTTPAWEETIAEPPQP